MADRLTQLQEALDQMATQFYACLRYISTHHAPPKPGTEQAAGAGGGAGGGAGAGAGAGENQGREEGGPVEEDPKQDNALNHNQEQQRQGQPSQLDQNEERQQRLLLQHPPRPDSPATFERRQQELARDLLVKQAQIEVLVARLPGVDRSPADQQRRLEALQARLARAELERRQAVAARDAVLHRLDHVILGLSRVS